MLLIEDRVYISAFLLLFILNIYHYITLEFTPISNSVDEKDIFYHIFQTQFKLK